MRIKNKENKVFLSVANESYADVARISGIFSEVIVVPQKNDTIGVLRGLLSIRRLKCDAGVLCIALREKIWTLLLHVIGISMIISPGYGNLAEYRKNEVDARGAIASKLHLNAEESPYGNQTFDQGLLSETSQEMLRNYNLISDKLIAICCRVGTENCGTARGFFVNGEGIAKFICAEKQLNLADELINRGYQVVLLGSREDSLPLKLDTGVIDLTGRLSLVEVASLESICQLVIGPEGGLIHMADAVGTKTLVYYAASSELCGPYSSRSMHYSARLECQPCLDENRSCDIPKCLKFITAMDLANLADSIMKSEK